MANYYNAQIGVVDASGTVNVIYPITKSTNVDVTSKVYGSGSATTVLQTALDNIVTALGNKQGTITAGTGLSKSGNTLSVSFGTSATTAAYGNHTHSPQIAMEYFGSLSNRNAINLASKSLDYYSFWGKPDTTTYNLKGFGSDNKYFPIILSSVKLTSTNCVILSHDIMYKDQFTTGGFGNYMVLMNNGSSTYTASEKSKYVGVYFLYQTS